MVRIGDLNTGFLLRLRRTPNHQSNLKRCHLKQPFDLKLVVCRFPHSPEADLLTFWFSLFGPFGPQGSPCSGALGQLSLFLDRVLAVASATHTHRRMVYWWEMYRSILSGVACSTGHCGSDLFGVGTPSLVPLFCECFILASRGCQRSTQIGPSHTELFLIAAVILTPRASGV